MVQIKHIIISLALLVSTFAIAESVNETHSEHKEHTRFGMHGMVLITDGVDLYASHLPLYQSPHDYQILYLVESKHNDVFIKYLTQAKQDVEPLYIQNMITLLPVGFDLNKLIAGNAFTIETQFFTGHFERGGQAWIKDKNFKFVRQVFKRSLSKIEYAATQDDNNWSLLTASNNKHQIMINNIHTAPSFDAIVLAAECPLADGFIKAQTIRVPKYEQLKQTFKDCASSNVLYLETQDFK